MDVRAGRPVIADCSIRSLALACVAVHDEANPLLRNCSISSSQDTGVFVYESGRGVFETCDIHGHGRSGVTIGEGGKAIFRSCQIRDNHGAGIFVFTGGSGRFDECHVLQNAKGGAVIGPGGRGELKRCQINQNKGEGVFLQEGALAEVHGCDLTDNAKGARACPSAASWCAQATKSKCISHLAISGLTLSGLSEDTAASFATSPKASSAGANAMERHKFYVEIIKPSHYDDDGYVIQWVRAFIPSNSLACVYGLCQDVQQRQALGADVELVINAYDEAHTIIPVRRIIERIRGNGGRGFVMLAGVQSNQFPRAADMAREFRAAGITVAIGGFHVSGCLAMLPELPPDIRAVQDLGVSLFGGEAEGRMEQVLADAYRGQLRPIYNYLNDLPDLQNQVVPALPPHVVERYIGFAPFDAGRGCPFQCSFCTIINVQGRKSRFRDADDIEQIVRKNLAQGTKQFFITDDDFARNKNWEAIFDRLIHLREVEGLKCNFLLQVDTQCHKIPGFIAKAGRAGCSRVFIGLESISAANLAAANKKQNHARDYRKMLLAWRKQARHDRRGVHSRLPG